MRSDAHGCLSYCDGFSPCREAPLEEALGFGYLVSYTMQRDAGSCVLQMRDAIPLDALQHPFKLKLGRYHDAGLCIGPLECICFEIRFESARTPRKNVTIR